MTAAIPWGVMPSRRSSSGSGWAVRPLACVSALVLGVLSAGAASCSEARVTNAAKDMQAAEGVATGTPAPPSSMRVTYARVPAGQVPMTDAQLRSTFVGKRYVDIQHSSAIVTEAFERDGTYRFESDYHSFGGAYWIADGWMCRRRDEPERPLTACSQVYALPTGDISYVNAASGRFQHYKVAD